MRNARYLFVFSSPKLTSLVYSQVFIEQKSYIYLHWEVENGYKMQIRNFRKVYPSKCILVLKVPGSLECLEIKYSNFWKTRKETINLGKITIDSDILPKLLDQQFHGINDAIYLNKINISDGKLRTYLSSASVVRPKMSLTKLNIQVKNTAFKSHTI